MLCVQDLRLLTQSNSALLGWSAFFFLSNIYQMIELRSLDIFLGKDTSTLYLASPNYLVLNNLRASFFSEVQQNLPVNLKQCPVAFLLSNPHIAATISASTNRCFILLFCCSAPSLAAQWSSSGETPAAGQTNLR